MKVMNTRCKIFLLLSLLLFNCCELFEPHEYAGKIRGEKSINTTNLYQIENNCRNKEVIKFAVISDSQGWYNQLEDCVNDINSRGDIDFVLHLGDLTDYGATHEFAMQCDILQKLKYPYLCVIGNHDCLGNGEYVFKEIFGDLNFSFMAGDTRFVMLNTNSLEFDYSERVPDFIYIEELLSVKNPSHKRTIVAMHAAPNSEQLVENLSKSFHSYISRFPNLLFCLNGHGHSFLESDIFNDGIVYYQCACSKKRGYYIFTLNADDYEKEIIMY